MGEKLMNKVTITEAQANLSDLLQQLAPGEELLIVSGDEPLAKLTRHTPSATPCRAGSAKSTDHWMAEDFDAPLDDFAEYME